MDIKKNNLSKLSKKQFQKNLLDWFHKNARSLPWRGIKDPYYIWISEIMLQQTRVDTVIKYFPLFIETFPTIHDLATSQVNEVLHYWQGLGYYRRALNIHKTAKIIDKEYHGHFPTNYKKIIALPGIGDYTSGAIASIAFNQALPAIDGNIKRVISRIFFLTEDINKAKTIDKIKEFVKEIISKEYPGNFNQALMEIGATLCSPKKPNCQKCPIKENCIAASKAKQELLPFRSKKKKPKILNMEIAIVRNKNGLLLVKRSSDIILAQLWGLPVVENQSQLSNGNDICNWVEKELNIPLLNKVILIKKLTYTFTHQIWKINLYLVNTRFQNNTNFNRQNPNACWIKKEELGHFPIPQAFRKCLKEYFNLSLVEG